MPNTDKRAQKVKEVTTTLCLFEIVISSGCLLSWFMCCVWELIDIFIGKFLLFYFILQYFISSFIFYSNLLGLSHLRSWYINDKAFYFSMRGLWIEGSVTMGCTPQPNTVMGFWWIHLSIQGEIHTVPGIMKHNGSCEAVG